MHGAFAVDGEEVQREWVRYTARVDAKLEDALRATVKRSLQVWRASCCCMRVFGKGGSVTARWWVAVGCGRACGPALAAPAVAAARMLRCRAPRPRCQALSRLLNGDSKTEVLPLFRVTMALERSACVELRPTIQQLFDTVVKVRGAGAVGGLLPM